jgi:hypothetical protein
VAQANGKPTEYEDFAIGAVGSLRDCGFAVQLKWSPASVDWIWSCMFVRMRSTGPSGSRLLATDVRQGDADAEATGANLNRVGFSPILSRQAEAKP